MNDQPVGGAANSRELDARPGCAHDGGDGEAEGTGNADCPWETPVDIEEGSRDGQCKERRRRPGGVRQVEAWISVRVRRHGTRIALVASGGDQDWTP
ncbi:MAG: hypothetical protein ABUS54_06135 [Actinomycetota bacterium]